MTTKTPNDGLPPKFGRYQLVERLAFNDWAELFSARRSMPINEVTQDVLIKRVRAKAARTEAIERLTQEGKFHQGLQHRNLLSLLDIETSKDRGLFLVFEKIEGIDLASFLHLTTTRGIRIPVWFAIWLTSQLLTGLEHLHERKISGAHCVHGQILPKNIFLARSGDLKLGTMAAPGHQPDRATMMEDQLPYLAPEQLLQQPISTRIDLHAVGAILFELLTQQQAFTGNEPQIRQQILQTSRTPPSTHNSGIPDTIDRIVLESLAMDPKRRTPTARQFIEQLMVELSEIRPVILPHDITDFVCAVIDFGQISNLVEMASDEEMAEQATWVLQTETDQMSGDNETLEEVFEHDEGFEDPMPRVDTDDIWAESEAMKADSDPSSPFELPEHFEDEGPTDTVPDRPKSKKDGFYVHPPGAKAQGPMSFSELNDTLKSSRTPGWSVSADKETLISVEDYAHLIGQSTWLEPPKLKSRAVSPSNTGLFAQLVKIERGGHSGRLSVLIPSPEYHTRARLDIVFHKGRPCNTASSLDKHQLPGLLIRKELLDEDTMTHALLTCLSMGRPLDEVVSEILHLEIKRLRRFVMSEHVGNYLVYRDTQFAWDRTAPKSTRGQIDKTIGPFMMETILQTCSIEDLLDLLESHLKSRVTFTRLFLDEHEKFQLGPTLRRSIQVLTQGKPLKEVLDEEQESARQQLAMVLVFTETGLATWQT